jgi:PKD repeat protein
MLRPMSEQEVRASAVAVVEGHVVGSRTAWLDGTIVTYWTFRVERTQQGTVSTPAIEIITLGGTIGETHLRVMPSEAPLMKDARVIAIEPWKGHYRVACGPQGILQRDEQRDKRTTSSRTQATISGVTPQTVTAGTNTAITITGTGFGVLGGQSRVQFRNADDPGTSWIDAPPNHVQSWLDTEIIVWVPSTIDGVARSGAIQVVTETGSVVTSAENITVLYAHLTVENTGGNVGVYTRPELHNDNGAGGFTFTMNQGYSANVPSENVLRRALSRWRCLTEVNFALGAVNTAIACPAQDNVNLVAWDNAGCQLPNGVLGVTYLWFQGCVAGGVQYWRASEMDIMADAETNWYFGNGAPDAAQFDLESMFVHELGHASLVEHDAAESSVMRPTLNTGAVRRVPNEPNDSVAVRDVVVRSATGLPCGATGAMQMINAGCSIAPPVASFTTSPTTGCTPLTVQFRSTSQFAPDQFEWDVNNDGVWDYFSPSPIHTYTAAGTYTVRLRVTNAYGNDQITVANAVSVSLPPTAAAGADAAVCAGTSVMLGAAVPAAGGLAPYTYRWSPASGLDDSTKARPMAAPLTTTIYTLTVTDARGCTASDAVEITVFAPPSIAQAPNVTACRGTTAQLRPQIIGGLPPFAYAWTPATGLNDPTVLQPFAQPSTTTTYILTVTDARGCIAHDTVDFTVQAPPGLSVDESLQICTGGSVMIDPVVSSGPEHGTVTYKWSPATGLSSTSIRNPVATPTTSTTYRLVITDVRGCSLTDSVVVVVVPELEPKIASTSGFTACEGQQVTLDAGGGYTRYRWSTGDTTRTITLVSNRTVTVEVWAGTGCTGTSDPVSVSFLPRPTAIVQGAATICQDSVTTYSVTETAGATYQWFVTGGEILSPSASPIIQIRWTGSSTAKISCSVLATTGCADTSEVLTVTIQPTPQRPDIMRMNELLTASLATSYQWLRNGAMIPGATLQQYVVTQDGRYAVRIWDASSCTNISDELNVIVSDVSIEEVRSVLIQPQPSHEEVSVRWPQEVSVRSIELLNLTGQRVYHADVADGALQHLLSVAALTTGEYVVVLRAQGRVYTEILQVVKR